MKYIEKAIEDRFGHDNQCWRVTRININLVDDIDENGNKTGEHFQAIIIVEAWKDLTAYQEGKPSSDKRTVVINNIETLSSFASAYNDISTEVLASAQFTGGVIKDTSST